MGRSHHRFQQGSAKGGKNRLSNKMYLVYIIKSLKVLRYYIGSTENVDRRLSDHNSGKVKSTKAFKSWELVYSERFDTKSDAIKRERQIKSYKSGNAFKKLLSL
jgi:putative endonuclease